MYLINLKTGSSVSMHPKDHKDDDKYVLDCRPDEDEGDEDEISPDQESSCSESDDDSDESDGLSFFDSERTHPSVVQQDTRARGSRIGSRRRFRLASRNADEHREEVLGEADLVDRLQDCNECEQALSRPLVDQVIFLHDFR